MRCVPPLDAVDEALGCTSLQWAIADGRKDEGKAGGSVKEIDNTVAGGRSAAICFKSLLHIVDEA